MNRFALYLAASLAAMVLAGCASLIDSEIHVSEQPADSLQIKYLTSIRIAGYVDGRHVDNPRRIGASEARVSGLAGTDVLLDRDVGDIVAESMSRHLTDRGMQVLGKDDASARFELTGVVKEFKYDVKARDYVDIKLETTLKEIATGKVLWAGEVEQKSDRFAGVSGNNTDDIAKYLKQELGVVTGKTAEAINSALMGAHPELFRVAPGSMGIPGVTVYTIPGVTSPVPTSPTATMPMPAANPPAPATSMPESTNGQLLVRTEPVRARIYLDGVYYGLSPIHVEATPGIHAVQAKLRGYRTASEKVSVRKGDTTELEFQLEK